MKLADVVDHLNQYLRVKEIKDYGPQGLQVETDNQTVQKVALAVDSAPAVISAAAEWGADMLLVHHGLFWRTVEPLNGPLGQRVRLLMKHGLNLYVAHLPLDAHPKVGNNAVLANMFGVYALNWWGDVMGSLLGVHGVINPTPLPDLAQQINQQLNTEAQVLAHGPELVQKVAILSGFGADKVAEVKALGVDTYITGEKSHANYWLAADYGLNVIFAGHYATETVGVQALGRYLHQQFKLETRFFDFPTQM